MFPLQLWQAENPTLIWKQAAENRELWVIVIYWTTTFLFPACAWGDGTGTKRDWTGTKGIEQEPKQRNWGHKGDFFSLQMMFIFEATAWKCHKRGRGLKEPRWNSDQIRLQLQTQMKVKLVFFKPNNNSQKLKDVNSGSRSSWQCKWTNISAKPSQGSNLMCMCIKHSNYTTTHTHTHTQRHPAHEYSRTNRFSWIIKWRK